MSWWTAVVDFSSVLPSLKHLNFNILYFLFANVFHSTSHPKVTTCCKIRAFRDLGTPKWFPCIPFHSAFIVFKNSEETERTLTLFFSFTSFFLNSSPQLQLQKAAVNHGPLKHRQSRPLPHNLLSVPPLPSPFSPKFNWDFSKLFSQMWGSSCLETQSPKTLHSSGASENSLSQEA